jgi:protein-glutamine gamma-glutamyltransferase
MDIELIRRLRRNLSLHFVIIAFLTALLIATASGGYYLAVLVVIFGVIGLVFVDTYRWFELGRISSYIAMSLATCVAIGSYAYSVWVHESEAGQLMAIAGLLIYPECVLFMQRKSLRVFEQLAVFLLLEMIVAAIINDDLFFGLLLTPIILLWVSSLFLFSRYATLVSISPRIDEPMPILVELLYRRLVKPMLREPAKNPTVTSRLLPSVDIQATKPARRLLQTLPIGIGALTFAAMFFYLLPRTSPGIIHAGMGGQAGVGLPSEITMGLFGRLLQNPTPVGRVTLRSARTGRPYRVAEPPYLRARVFDTYFPPRQVGQQTYQSRWGQATTQPFHPKLEPSTYYGLYDDASRDLVEIEFDIQREFASTLYSIPPAFANLEKSDIDLNYDRFNMLLDPLDPTTKSIGKSLIYTVGSAGFKNNKQLPISPAHIPGSSVQRKLEQLLSPLGDFREADRVRRKILADQKVPESDKYRAAKAYEEHFVFSGQYTYTLDLRPPLDSRMDPIEDFIVNQPQGHCQYFAAAMIAFLRQNEIPSRIVVGYRPTDFNNFGYFRVKQNDAHAWVEALFLRDQLQGTELEPWLSEKHVFYWVRFDPTPGSDGGAVEIREQPGQAMDFAEKLWKDYVVDAQRLRAGGIYSPVTSGENNAYAGFIAQMKEFSKRLQNGTLLSSDSGIGFAWPVTIAFIALGVMALALWQVWSALPRWAPHLARRLGMASGPATPVRQPFYARCLELLSRRGFNRQSSDTMQEFTGEAALKMQSADMRAALDYLTKVYYRLRFGSPQELSTAEMHEVQHALEKVEQAVSKAPPSDQR